MKKVNRFFFWAIMMIALFSCKKVIDISLNNSAPQIVIQGNITNVPGFYQVIVSRSIAYSSDNIFPMISGAVLRVKDSTSGLTETLRETTPGTYETLTIQGIEGHVYVLNVTAEGKTYRGVSTMPRTVNLDSVSFIINTGFGQTLINPAPNFQDPPGIANYYFFKEILHGKESKKIFVFDDRLSDGKYIARQLFNDSSVIDKGDTVELEMQCIDKPAYDYFKQLSGLDPTNGQPTSPTNPESNIRGGALGYFSAHTVQRKKAIVK